MKIVIDGRWIFPELSGIGMYTRELLREFAQIDHKRQYMVLFDNNDVARQTAAYTGIGGRENFTTAIVPWGVFSPASQLRLPHYLAASGCDIFHSPNYMVPLFPRLSGIGAMPAVMATIHDVIPLVVPDHAPKSRKTRLMPLFRWVMRRAARVSDAIITVSRRSREDLVQQLRIPPSRVDDVHVVYNGVSAAYHPPDARQIGRTDPERIRTLLYVGRADPYKNVALLVRALAMLRKRCPFRLQLVIVGSVDPRYPEAEHLAAELGVASAVRWTGYLSDEELIRTYHSADVLVHPSRYEGFGLQVLEAMACGVPVICSNAGALPEVAGNAALMVAPDDLDAFVRHIQDVLTKPELADQLSERGLDRVARFTWSRAAKATVRVYDTVHRKHTATRRTPTGGQP